MNALPERLPQLRPGWHLGPDDGACLMEYVSVLAGVPFTDSPRCTDSLLAALTRGTETRACPADHGTGSRSQILIEARSMVPRNV
jgi:hypothetical protein